MRDNSEEKKFALLLIAPAAIIIFGVVIFPMITTFIYSLQDLQVMSVTKGAFVWLSNYVIVLSLVDFWAAFWRTLYFTVISTAIETILGLFIALLLNENFWGVKFLRTIIIIPWAIPGIVNGSMWKWIYNGEYGVLNAMLTKIHLLSEYKSWLSEPFAAMNMVIIADAWKMTPLAVIFFLASLQTINISTYEAAVMDGAGIIRRFFTLTIPYLKPTLLIVIVMRTVEKFKAFDIFYIITRGGPANGTKVLVYEAYQQAFTNLQYSFASTYAYLIAIIIVVLTVIYMKTLKRGEGMYE